MNGDGREIPLFEREEELRRLHRWVGDVVQGRGRVGLVEGEPGIGKSLLVRELASYSAKCGVQVLHAAGEEIEADVPSELFSTRCLARPTVRHRPRQSWRWRGQARLNRENGPRSVSA